MGNHQSNHQTTGLQTTDGQPDKNGGGGRKYETVEASKRIRWQFLQLRRCDSHRYADGRLPEPVIPCPAALAGRPSNGGCWVQRDANHPSTYHPLKSILQDLGSQTVNLRKTTLKVNLASFGEKQKRQPSENPPESQSYKIRRETKPESQSYKMRREKTRQHSDNNPLKSILQDSKRNKNVNLRKTTP